MIEPSTAATGEHVIRNRDDFIEALRARKDEIGLSNSYIEHALHLGAGGCDKYLGPSRTKNLSLLMALDLVELLGSMLALKRDAETEARMAPRWERRDEAQVRRCSRVSMRLVEACRPMVLRELTSKASKARKTKMTAAARKRIAKLAARARWSRAKSKPRRKAAA
jgi:hypothetical protein